MRNPRRSRRLITFGLLAVMLLALGAQPALGRNGGGEGRPVNTFHAEDGEAPPAWAQAAIERGRSALAASYNPADLVARDVVADDLGMQHVRYDQRYAGLPVFGGQVIAQLDSAGSLRGQFGQFYQNIGVATKPAITANRAIRIAKRALGYGGQFTETPAAQLLVLPTESGQYVLAYHVRLKIEDGTEATAHHEYFVNAQDGSIAWHYDSLPHEDRDKPRLSDATGSGRSLYSGTVSIHTDLVNGTYYLRDNTRGGMYTNDVNNRTDFFFQVTGTTFTDSDNVWGTGTTSSRQSAGVDAHFGAQQTWDYYLNVHGRRGIDGRGYRMLSRVHYGRNYNNAFWNGSSMAYGDGDGTTFSPLVALDVAGHEITHGVTEKTANLTYSGESGAANESFSDIFGSAIEFYTGAVGGRSPDYLIGEDIYTPGTPGDALRSMADPASEGDPDHYSKRYTGSSDNGGVHINSGIQNQAFYLLAEGGTNRTSGLSVTGIGRAKAEKIFYRALTLKLTSSANFSRVRAGCLAAAADLYGTGSAEYNATAQAWTAVGVN